MSYGFGRLNDLAEECFENSKRHGFWDEMLTATGFPSKYATPTKLMLIVSEVAEAMEADRKGDKANFAEELADIAIRLFDLAEAHHINLEQEIVNKMAINAGRPVMHGGKRY